MALKITLETEYGSTVNVNYVDVNKFTLHHYNRYYAVSVTLNGWVSKTDCRNNCTPIWTKTYNLELTDDQIDEAMTLIYGVVMADISAFTNATAIYDVSAVALDSTSLALTVGNTGTLTATVTPTTASDTSVTWSSSDETIATVSDGTVTAVAAGTATITCTSDDDSNITATCDITVTEET